MTHQAPQVTHGGAHQHHGDHAQNGDACVGEDEADQSGQKVVPGQLAHGRGEDHVSRPEEDGKQGQGDGEELFEVEVFHREFLLQFLKWTAKGALFVYDGFNMEGTAKVNGV